MSAWHAEVDVRIGRKTVDTSSSFVKRHSLVIFFLLAYAITWMLWLPVAAASQCALPFSISQNVGQGMLILGGFGPSLAGLILVRLTGGRDGVRSLLRRLFIWKVNPLWYVGVLLSPFIVIAATERLHSALHDRVPDFANNPLIFPCAQYNTAQTLAKFNHLSLLIPLFVMVLLIAGPLGEELGWRGFALPELQRRRSPLIASLILGVLWGVWHAPLFFVVGAPFFGAPLWLFIIMMVALSILFTWVYNNTKGSLLLVLLFHAAIDTAIYYLRLFPTITGIMRPVIMVALAIIGLAVILVFIARSGHVPDMVAFGERS